MPIVIKDSIINLITAIIYLLNFAFLISALGFTAHYMIVKKESFLSLKCKIMIIKVQAFDHPIF